MGTCPDAVKRLVDRFNQQADQVKSPDYNETQLRIDFINPLFRELGWDVDNAQGYAEQYREVVHEDRVKVGGQTKEQGLQPYARPSVASSPLPRLKCVLRYYREPRYRRFGNHRTR